MDWRYGFAGIFVTLFLWTAADAAAEEPYIELYRSYEGEVTADLGYCLGTAAISVYVEAGRLLKGNIGDPVSDAVVQKYDELSARCRFEPCRVHHIFSLEKKVLLVGLNLSMQDAVFVESAICRCTAAEERRRRNGAGAGGAAARGGTELPLKHCQQLTRFARFPMYDHVPMRYPVMALRGDSWGIADV